MKAEKKTFASLPLYIVTTLFAFGCVSGIFKVTLVNKSLHTSSAAHQGGAYPGFVSMKWLGVFLLRPGWNVSPSEGYSQ